MINSPGDADVDIVKASVERLNLHSTTLIGEDTDLLALLLYYAHADGPDLYFRSDNKSNKAIKVYNIKRLKAILGDLCSQLLFVHAFTGCDTTSRIFGVGKKSVFQRLVKDSTMQSTANAFLLQNQTKEVIENLGCQVMVIIFGGKGTDSLASLRYNIFTKKVVAAKSFVIPERLPLQHPPLSSTASGHTTKSWSGLVRRVTWMP